MASLPRPFGRYILEKRIAMGGMAEIFRGRTSQEGFAKTVCIKRVLPSFLKEEDFVKMFRDEASLVARLQHANVVQVFDFGEAVDEGDDEPSLYLVMELVDGCDLKKLITLARKRGEPIGIAVATQIAIEVCRGLHHAHSLTIDGRPQNLIHRDVSPHNILLSRQGEVKVTDFGIAKAAERATHTSTGIVKGKISYMAPEQLEGAHINHRLDQFAAGVVFFEMLTGRRLFDGDSDATILRQVMMCEIPRPSTVRGDIPPQLEAVLMKALSASPDERYADMRALEQELTRFLYSYTSDPAETDVRALVAELLDKAPARKTALVQRPKKPAATPATNGADESGVSLTAAASIVESPATSSDVFSGGNDASLTDFNSDVTAATDIEEGIRVSSIDATAALATGEIFSNPPLEPEVAAAQSQTRTLAIGTDAVVDAAPVAQQMTGTHSQAGPMVAAPSPEKKGPPVVAMAAVGGLCLAGALGVAMVFAGGDPAKDGAPEQAPVGLSTTAGKTELKENIAPVANANTNDAPPSKEDAALNATAEAAKAEEAAKVDETTKAVVAVEAAPENAKKKPARRRRSRAPKNSPKTVATKKPTEEAKAATPAGEGLLVISVNDSWAFVYEKGKKLGETPLMRKFSAGRHQFTLKNPETGKTSAFSIVVKAGGKQRKVVSGF